jgi:hypothetical protein
VLIPLGQDNKFNIPQPVAAVAMTTFFGMAELSKFTLVTNEVREAAPSQGIRPEDARSDGC